MDSLQINSRLKQLQQQITQQLSLTLVLQRQKEHLQKLN